MEWIKNTITFLNANPCVTNLALLVILIITSFYYYLQTRLQKKTHKAQIFKDRVEMYWKTKEPITDAHITNVVCFHENYIEGTVYNTKYKGNSEKIRKYLYLVKLYEYFLNVYRSNNLESDLLGNKTMQKSLIFLLNNDEFNDIRKFYKDYYEEFEKYINDVEVMYNASQEKNKAKQA